MSIVEGAPSNQARSPVGLYVHFPFCLSVCPYCDFVVYAGRQARGPANRIDALVDALVVEIGLRGRPARLRSVYLGGGTPSLMSAVQVERLLAAADAAFGIEDGAEITLEVNPGRGERGDLAGFRAAGVNRLSIGAQSMAATELRRLGRRHSASDVAQTVRAARKSGFDNISLDLLYDVPDQTVATWRASLEATIALAPEHVSAYALTLEGSPATSDHLPTSAGALRWRARARAEQDEDRAADMYELADELLARAGLEWYEISNWARPGRESRHNMAYWLGDAWAAVGPGAHSFDGRRTRRWNAANLEFYLAALSDGRLPPGGADTPSALVAQADQAILGLRTRSGLPASVAGRARIGEALAWAAKAGLSEEAADGAVRLTMRGRLLADELALRLMPDDASGADHERFKHRSAQLERSLPLGDRAADEDRKHASIALCN